MGSKAFFTTEDIKIAFNLFCCVYGIGTLGMPANFSRAGPALAVVALLFMAFANVYASVSCSRVLLVAPRSVKTFGDLGEFCMGKPGRALVVVAQMSVCLLVPCAFLVLGGILLDGLFPNTFSQTSWIIFMALSVLPVCLTPTMKEGAGAAFAGCMGTIIADVIGVGVLVHGMQGHPEVPKPNISFEQVATTFGNLALAYGAGIVIPALQRQHSQPERMPRVVGVTMTFISVLFLILAISGYSVVGCQIMGNLLFTIYPDPNTKLTSLGFKPDFGAVVMAYLFMQLHITIAFACILHPAFYMAERMILGMHRQHVTDVENPAYEAASTPGDSLKHRPSKQSVVSMADIEKEDLEEDESEEYKGTKVMIKYVTLRVVMICLLVLLSIALQDHFLELTDFIGASAITVSCLILPIVFYLKKMWHKVHVVEKVVAITVVIVCGILGCYVTYNSGKAFFSPAGSSGPTFPFCHGNEFNHTERVYFNQTAVELGVDW